MVKKNLCSKICKVGTIHVATNIKINVIVLAINHTKNYIKRLTSIHASIN